MNTDNTGNQPVNEPTNKKDDSLVELVDTLQKIDEKSPDAKINETSMDDNNGERIEFNDGSQATPTITRSSLNSPSSGGGTFFSVKKRF